LTVEVLNGSGDRGAAARIRDHLRERGFDVVSAENADHFDHPVTYVLNRSGRNGAAQRVARQLGVDSVANAFEPDLFLDATVVLGGDWLARLSGVTGGGAVASTDGEP
ncbi:MAG: LytR C-terminal domain-containing protein, partial [Gemmatimonadota bacterium]